MSSARFGAAAPRLFLVSFLALFVELMLIRWIPSALHVVAFFNNLVLIACFLGLGVGMTRPRPLAEAVWRGSFRLLVLMALLCVVAFIDPSVERGSTYFLNEMILNPAIRLPLGGVLLAVFALVAWTLVPFGEMVAVCFDEMERIPAYTVNILGSLAGVLAFAGCSWLELPPYWWFGLAGLGMLLAGRQLAVALAFALMLGCLVIQEIHVTQSGKLALFWSPYYKVLARPVQDNDLTQGLILEVNNQFLLSGIDLGPKPRYTAEKIAAQMRGPGQPEGAELLKNAEKHRQTLEMLRSYYDFPFELRPAKRVLILGSGAGNDVAAALRHGAEEIVAVEIDPRVLALGKAYHPEKPYSSPKVRVILDDARVFLNQTKEKFDLIIFATLDAHGLLSTVGNVRLDSFIYTRESLALAKAALAEKGILCLSFGPFVEATQFRQFATFRDVFGRTPLYFEHRNDHRTLVAGALEQLNVDKLPAVRMKLPEGVDWRRIGEEEVSQKLKEYPEATIPATDDWPHLYLKKPGVPVEYLGVLAGVLLCGLVMVLWRFRGQARFEPSFFFLGAGFLLMETKSVTEFALLMGSTWQVNVLVFSVILIVILLANLLILTVLKNLNVPATYALLAVGLLAGYFYPPSSWAQTGATLYMGAALYLGVPIFLAGLIFARTFKDAPLGSAALAANILGSVLGGCTEYLSLAFGLRSLALLALGMYTLAYFSWVWRRKAMPT